MKRRTFIKSTALAGVGLVTSGWTFGMDKELVRKGLRVGIIGLDTSHAVAFTKSLNASDASPEFGGYKVVAAYPQGSKDIESSIKRVPGYIEEVRKLGVEIVDSISELLKKVDVVLLETNDGRPHPEQAIPVFKAGKPVFIDKPVAGTLTDAYTIFQAAKDYKAPVFSASSLRYMSNMDDIIKNQSIGKILGAESFSPSPLEATHPDFFWYGIHGIEALFTVMGTGCQTVSRVHTPDTDVVTGIWKDDRIGAFRGLRAGKTGYGGYAFGDKGIKTLGDYNGYDPLLKEIIKFFQTKISPVTPGETLEIFTFMEAADESKRRGGASVSMAETRQKALNQVKKVW
ncbi:MAG: Gfo/Idh/MocA family oxidoreductase [Dysgonamonadaceae bacterium]|jgi:predicted dehydrogenase|nr:Gfo/Idh/MocA family oxidoreductase [Dysgonamonadaceae bacterium]